MLQYIACTSTARCDSAVKLRSVTFAVSQRARATQREFWARAKLGTRTTLTNSMRNPVQVRNTHRMLVCMYECERLCMHVCAYVCIYVIMHLCMHACVYTGFVCLTVCLSVCLYVYTQGVYVCVSVRQSAWMYLCMYVYTQDVYAFLCIGTCVRAVMYLWVVHICSRAGKCIHMQSKNMHGHHITVYDLLLPYLLGIAPALRIHMQVGRLVLCINEHVLCAWRVRMICPLMQIEHMCSLQTCSRAGVHVGSFWLSARNSSARRMSCSHVAYAAYMHSMCTRVRVCECLCTYTFMFTCTIYIFVFVVCRHVYIHTRTQIQ